MVTSSIQTSPKRTVDVISTIYGMALHRPTHFFSILTFNHPSYPSELRPLQAYLNPYNKLFKFSGLGDPSPDSLHSNQIEFW